MALYPRFNIEPVQQDISALVFRFNVVIIECEYADNLVPPPTNENLQTIRVHVVVAQHGKY